MANEATLVDTKFLLDLVTDDPRWAGWSVRELERPALRGRLVINDVIYAELSVRYAGIEALDDMVAGLTRDAGRYRGYFPSVEVMAP